MLRKGLGVFCCLLAAQIAMADQAQETAPPIKRITIASGWGGLGQPSRAHLVIEPEGKAYRLTVKQVEGFDKKDAAIPAQIVLAEKVQDLLAAMRAPLRTTLDAALFEPFAAHMQQQIDRGIEQMKIPEDSPVRQKVADWRNGLRQQDALMAALKRGLVTTHTDDYPFVLVQALLADGSTVSMRSGSQHFMMLPWRNDKNESSYAVEFPVALAAVLPPSIVNRDRMGRDSLEASDLDEVLGAGLANDAGRLRAEAAAPDAFRVLREHFVIISIEPGRWDNKPQFNGEFRLPDGPANLSIHAQFDYNGTALADPRQVEQVSGQLRRAASSPGMSARMRAHPNDDYRISTFGWAFWNKPTAEQFLRQMQAIKKLPELKSQPGLVRGAVMIEEGRKPSYWVVLADGRAVLWKTYSHDEDDPSGMRCEDVPMQNAIDDPNDREPPPKDSICYGKVFGA